MIDDARSIVGLRNRLRGTVVHRDDGAYPSAAASPFANLEVPWTPAAVVQPAGVADVIAAVEFARQSDRPVALRSGGVGWIGAGSDSLLVDLARLDGITVDASRRRVRVEGGAIWRDVNRELAPFGLAAASPQFPRLGVAGHVLGGGHGWLSSRLGWASDTLVSVDVVTAQGELVHASEGVEPDLFWGMRGAGHNFGVVVGLELDLIPLDEVTFGFVWFHPDATAEAMRLLRDWIVDAPDELTAIISAAQPPQHWSGPDHLRGRPAVHALVCHSGTARHAERDLSRLAAHPAAVAVEVNRIPWPALSAGNDVFPPHVHRRTRMRYVRGLTDDVIELTVGRVPQLSASSFVSIHYNGGALARRGEDATAMSHRDSPWNYAVTTSWGAAEDGTQLKRWQDQYLSALGDHAHDRFYVNYLNHEPSHVPSAYNTRTWQRLRHLKARWDPSNLFRENHNVPPATAQEGRPHDRE
jgi:FAD/FMN-containing dehydrogenase